jgi:hypothetical protein
MFILAIALGSATLHGQMPGRWVGTTSHGGAMEFQVNPEGVTPIQSEFSMTCESGAQFQTRLTVFSPPVPIIDQSFEERVPPREFGGIAFAFAGTFSSGTEATGSASFILPTFRILDEGFTSQLCQDEVEWTAVWQESSAPQRSASLRLAPGEQATTYSDGNVSIQLVTKAPAPR